MKDRTKRDGKGRDAKSRNGQSASAKGPGSRGAGDKPAGSKGRSDAPAALRGPGKAFSPSLSEPKVPKPARGPRPDAPIAAEAKGRPEQGHAPETREAMPPLPPRRLWTGDKPAERVPVILETVADGNGEGAGYHLIDSGDGLKLEQYGPYRIVRPEAQALWPKGLDEAVWARADAVFTGDTDEDGMGRWRFLDAPLGETWPMRLLDTDFLGRFTAFRHVGVFPEQLAHWRWVKDQVEAAKTRRARPVRVLNLFGYTGVASLIAAKAGAEVTHVDASKKAIGWARENQALGRAEELPIRWICDDAMKFIQREERRGSGYDIILTDPPKFGRGPNGEVWQLFDHLPGMLDLCRAILSPEAIGLVLTAYSIRASFYSIHELMRETMRGAGGRVESGELILREAGLAGDEPGRALSTSLFSRWIAHDE
ncbi:SAM-dependent methyltransferase [Rhizobium rhizosphaerae]|uniref:SAM-dependent methyltransferase n=1 Tax=Xaviernesmea rhizosphaerae TaxID=1672749 RepID=A0A1Q9AEM9_9HYPH|nr:class I SAM-dependent rRNA methyltransferase [Xaviernesmea rhizosphaerae]OLP53394.1 SAM-dependent methyltransferase [Xaviernesmea rhizosphaerae]